MFFGVLEHLPNLAGRLALVGDGLILLGEGEDLVDGAEEIGEGIDDAVSGAYLVGAETMGDVAGVLR
jgi:hypothetical protein